MDKCYQYIIYILCVYVHVQMYRRKSNRQNYFFVRLFISTRPMYTKELREFHTALWEIGLH